MSLLFMEGWDDGNHASKWDILQSFSIGTGFGRTSRGLQHNGNQASQSVKYIPGNNTIIFGAAIQRAGAGNNTFHNLSFSEDGVTNHFGLQIKSNGSIVIYRGSTQIDASATGVLGVQTWHYLEVKVTIHDSTGVAQVRVDGTQVINFSGDTRNGGSETIDAVTLGGNSGSNARISWDDIYIADDNGTENNDFLGDCIVETLSPDGNGNYSDWVGSDADSTDNYLHVDEAPSPDEDTSYVESGTATDMDTYTFDDLTADTAASVFGVQACARARHDGGGGTMRLMHRRATTDTPGATQTPAASYAALLELWEQDPAAGPGAWTVANVNASEWGQEIVS